MTPYQRVVLYDTMLKGDGCWDEASGRFRKFVAGTKERADVFLMLCALVGKPANAKCRDFSDYKPKKYASMGNIPKSGPCWMVELKQSTRAQSGYGKSIKRWKGKVWCPTIEHGTWIAKRNGTVFVTGNSPVQRFASDITLMAMVQFSEGCPSWALPIGTVHDSGIIEAPEDKTKKVASWLKWCFVNPPLERLFGIRLPIPLDADVSVGPNLGEMSELKGVIAVKPPWIVI